MTKVEARQLDAPVLAFGSSVWTMYCCFPAHITQKETPRQGTWDLRDKRMMDITRLDSWAVIYFDGALQTPAIKDFFEFFFGLSQKHGFSMNPRPDGVANVDSVPENLAYNLRAFSDQFPNAQLIFVLLPDKSMSFYGWAVPSGTTQLNICRPDQERL